MIERMRIGPGERPRIAARDPRDDLGLRDNERAHARLEELKARIEGLRIE